MGPTLKKKAHSGCTVENIIECRSRRRLRKTSSETVGVTQTRDEDGSDEGGRMDQAVEVKRFDSGYFLNIVPI